MFASCTRSNAVKSATLKDVILIIKPPITDTKTIKKVKEVKRYVRSEYNKGE